MSKSQFFIPRVSNWNWAKVDRRFMKNTYERALQTRDEIDNALAVLAAERRAIEDVIREKFGSANANTMRYLHAELKELDARRAKVLKSRQTLLGVIDRLYAGLNERGSERA